MIFYIENSPKIYTCNLMELVSEFSKIAEDQINIKNQLYFYMVAVNNWNNEKSFAIAQKQ